MNSRKLSEKIHNSFWGCFLFVFFFFFPEVRDSLKE